MSMIYLSLDTMSMIYPSLDTKTMIYPRLDTVSMIYPTLDTMSKIYPRLGHYVHDISQSRIHFVVPDILPVSDIFHSRTSLMCPSPRFPSQNYCTVLYCTVLYSTVLYCTVLYCTVLLYIVPSFPVITTLSEIFLFSSDISMLDPARNCRTQSCPWSVSQCVVCPQLISL